MKLEVGMYVRTKITDNCNCVYIRQITEIETDVEKACRNQICIDEDVIDGWGDDRIWIDIEDVSKSSNNIIDLIDLIEVGDYVNGSKVMNIVEEDGTKYLVLDRDEVYYDSCLEPSSDKDIKSIVTKEQFESMSYKVKK